MKAKKMNKVNRSRIVTGGLIFIAALSSHAGSHYKMSKSVIASGGQAKVGSYELNGAIGQYTTTKSASTTYQISAGFYQENSDLIFFNKFENNQFN